MTNEKRASWRSRYLIDWASFRAISSMLLNNRFKVSFRDNWKKSLTRLFLFIMAFVVITAAMWLFYFLAAKLTIFSALPFVPFSVPSLLSVIVFVLGFISLCNDLTKDLYFSDDNKVLLTYPTNGNTLLASRVFSFFIYEFVLNIFLQVPIYAGYIICFGYAYWLILWAFLSWFLLTLAEMGVAAFLSVPLYGLYRILKKHPWARFVAYFAVYGTLIGLASYLVSLVPDHVDIFTNWGAIFSSIQSFLNGYTRSLAPLFRLTQGLAGYAQTGTQSVLFPETGLVALGVAIGIGLLFFIVALVIVNPLFLKYSSSSFEDGAIILHKKSKIGSHSPFVSALRKEIIGFVRDPSAFMPFFGSCVFVPLLTILLNKFYGAINTDTLGEILVEVTEFLVLLLFMLNSSSFLGPLYNREGNSLALEVSYPLKSSLLLLSKALLPGLLGSLSIIVSISFYGVYVKLPLFQIIFVALAALATYHGHLLFTIKESSKQTGSGLSNQSGSFHSQTVVTFMAFLIPIAFSALFFLYLRDGFLLGSIKILILGVLYLTYSIVSYVRYSKYLFGEGQV